jgi:hypothetical protein
MAHIIAEIGQRYLRGRVSESKIFDLHSIIPLARISSAVGKLDAESLGAVEVGDEIEFDGALNREGRPAACPSVQVAKLSLGRGLRRAGVGLILGG